MYLLSTVLRVLAYPDKFQKTVSCARYSVPNIPECRSLVSVRSPDAVHRRMAWLSRLCGFGLGDKPLWAAGGGCLVNRTSGRYKQKQGSGNHIQNHAGKQKEKPCKSYQQGQDQGYREQRQLY